jgi:hypothetical protein
MHPTKIISCAVLALALFFAPKRAEALVNVGAEGGIVKRSADSPANLKLGLGYGLHGELDLFPLLKVGPYYLHYELSGADSPVSTAFNTLGLRARLTLPIPGSYKPYAFAGIGYTWANYTLPAVAPLPAIDNSGHFLETPLGAGLAYEVVEIFQLSLDFAFRPGFSFGGDAFNNADQFHPSSGWSLLLGASLNL